MLVSAEKPRGSTRPSSRTASTCRGGDAGDRPARSSRANSIWCTDVVSSYVRGKEYRRTPRCSPHFYSFAIDAISIRPPFTGPVSTVNLNICFSGSNDERARRSRRHWDSTVLPAARDAALIFRQLDSTRRLIWSPTVTDGCAGTFSPAVVSLWVRSYHFAGFRTA